LIDIINITPIILVILYISVFLHLHPPKHIYTQRTYTATLPFHNSQRIKNQPIKANYYHPQQTNKHSMSKSSITKWSTSVTFLTLRNFSIHIKALTKTSVSQMYKQVPLCFYSQWEFLETPLQIVISVWLTSMTL
jgi:hypothetical protein